MRELLPDWTPGDVYAAAPKMAANAFTKAARQHFKALGLTVPQTQMFHDVWRAYYAGYVAGAAAQKEVEK